MLGAESVWHDEKQMDLRRQVQETDGLNVKKYKQVDEVCDFIKKVITSSLCNVSCMSTFEISVNYTLSHSVIRGLITEVFRKTKRAN